MASRFGFVAKASAAIAELDFIQIYSPFLFYP
jgi:hypothetical protein